MVELYTQPAQHTPAYNPIVFSFDSDNKTETDFNYVVRAYINGSSSYTQWLVPPSPTTYGNGLGKKDLSRFASAQLKPFIDTSTSGIKPSEYSIVKLTVTIGESYGGGTTGDMVTGDHIYAYYGSIRYPEFVAYSQNARTFSTISGTKKFLSPMPTTRQIAITEKAWLTGVIRAVATAERFWIKTYDSAGAMNGSFYISYAKGTLLPYAQDKMPIAPCGVQLNSASPTVVTGATPILDSAVASYQCYWTNSSNVVASEVITFNVVTRNCLHTAIRLHWINRWGGWDSQTFDLVNKYRYSVENKTFKRDIGEWAVQYFQYGTDDIGRANYSSRERVKYKLRSDYIDADTYAAMGDILGSPLMLAEIGGQFVAVRCTTTDFDERTLIADGLINMELDIEFMVDNTRQTW